MDNELCTKHSVQLAEVKTEIKAMRSEIAGLRGDIKDGNGKVLKLFSDTLKRQDATQNKSLDIFGKITTIAVKITAAIALVAWGVKGITMII